LFLVLCFFAAGCALQKQHKVCFEKNCVRVELASTDEQRSRGLMDRDKLSDDAGMLFIFSEEDFYSFWMKNMRIPLDVVWISREKKVVDITSSVLPCGESCVPFSPGSKAAYVLEVNAGFCKKNGISAGDKVRIKYE
jgi:hypothetical protein